MGNHFADDNSLSVRVDVHIDPIESAILACAKVRTDVQGFTVVYHRVPRTMAIDRVLTDSCDEVKT